MGEEAVIVSAVRTPIGKKGGALASLSPSEYGGLVMKEALERSGLKGEEIDEVIFGNCLAGGGNVARVSLLKGGLPVEVPGVTIDRQCGSGMNSVALGAEGILAGKNTAVIAGGTESMSRSPYLLAPQEKAYDRTPPKFVKRSLAPEEIGDPPMGITAENLAEKYDITREEQDKFAEESQRKMAEAMKEGIFDDQILKMTLQDKKGEITFEQDEHPRPGVTQEDLAKLPPVFKKGGSVTAGNSSGVNDGASALVLMSYREAQKRGLEPLAFVKDWSIVGVDPNIMGIGPVPAIRSLLQKNNLRAEDIDLFEINEAFAAQVIACNRELLLNEEKLNVNGGAIAHGHPIAATGAMLVTKLAYEMKRRDVNRGIVSACIGGGQGIALLIER